MKGEYQTQIEIYNAKLKNINEQLVRALSGPNGITAKAADNTEDTKSDAAMPFCV